MATAAYMCPSVVYRYVFNEESTTASNLDVASAAYQYVFNEELSIADYDHISNCAYWCLYFVTIMSICSMIVSPKEQASLVIRRAQTAAAGTTSSATRIGAYVLGSLKMVQNVP